MLQRESTFDRFNRAIQAGKLPDPKDVDQLEARAAALHNHYPQKIDGLNADLKETKKQLDQARLQLESATESIVQAVVMAKDETTKKPIYSNESLRGIEIKKRTQLNQNCARLNAQIETLEEKHAFNVVLLERARHDYAAWRDMNKFEIAALQLP